MNMRQFFTEDPLTHQIRLTETGIDNFSARFKRAGISIDEIRTRSQFEAAIELSFEQDPLMDRYCDEYLNEVLFADWDFEMDIEELF